jgi:hypothetical protein
MNPTAPTSAAELGFTIPLTKIDVEKRLVYGVAALEQPDRTKEILDYEWSKPNFLDWSRSFSEATGGLSKGNVRVMHTKEVAGALREFECDDVNKRFNVCAHVVDDQAWRKVLAGAFTGFSVGGKYGRSEMGQDGLKRYEAIPSEISLVDRPCIPGAQFVELVKADGVVERMELRGVPAVASFTDAWASRPVAFADAWALAKAALAPAPADFEGAWKLAKGYDQGKHPREHDGKFSRKTGEKVGRTAGLVLGGIGGVLLARRYGQRVGGFLAEKAARGLVGATNAIARHSEPHSYVPPDIMQDAKASMFYADAHLHGQLHGMSRTGRIVGGTLGAGAGYVTGGAVGRAHDDRGRNARALAAGKH